MHKKRKLHLDKIKTGKFKPKTPLPKNLIKENNLQLKKLIKENVDYDDEHSTLSVKNTVDTVHSTAMVMRGAAEITKKTSESIPKVSENIGKAVSSTRRLVSRVNRTDFSSLTSADVRHIAGRVGKTGVTLAGKAAVKGSKVVGNIAKKSAVDLRERVLSSSIDKSKVTDTGMETINQGITYVRYAENTRRTIVNVKRTSVKGIKTSVNAVKKIRSLPRDTVQSIRRTGNTVRNTAVRTKQTVKAIANASKKVAALAKNAVMSKAFPVLLAIAALLVIIMTIPNIATLFTVLVGSLFSWADDDESHGEYKKQIEEYIQTVKEIVSDEQQKVDDFYYGFECDRKEYAPYDEITELREERFIYRKLAIDTDEEYKQVIAIAAAKWYTDTLNADTPPENLQLKKGQLEKVIQTSYNLKYSYEQDYCPHYDGCCEFGNIMTGGNAEDGIYGGDAWYCDKYYHGCKEIFEWYGKNPETNEWDWDNLISGDRTFCDRMHTYLKGEVENFSLDFVMTKMSFTDEEKDMYETYYAVINEWLAEE